MIEEWHQKQVIDKFVTAVDSNMDVVTELVKADARKRMLNIKYPDWGSAYREYLALYKLKIVKRRGDGFIEGQIGLPPGEAGSDYGFWIETGSKTAGPHPWLRPALIHSSKTIVKILTGVK